MKSINHKVGICGCRQLSNSFTSVEFQAGLLLNQNGSEAGFFSQTSALTRRSFRNMRRDLGYYWLRLIIYIALGVSIGSVFRNVGTSWNAIRVSPRFKLWNPFFVKYFYPNNTLQVTMWGVPGALLRSHGGHSNMHINLLMYITACNLVSETIYR